MLHHIVLSAVRKFNICKKQAYATLVIPPTVINDVYHHTVNV